ncbi:MAG TPA: PAS domain-containing protein, partial [Gemmata sp.]
MGQDSPLHTNPRAAPVRVAGGYLLFGLLWIWLSDRAVLALGLDGVEGFWVGATKGTVFVALSAALLYWLVGREVRALTRTMGLLRAIAEGTPDAVFVKDLSGKYLLINHAGAEIIGRPVADIIGADDTALFVPETAERLMAQDRAVVASGAARNTEADLVTPSGPRTFSATKAPYRDASGAVLGVLGISRDVTDHKKAEAERRSHLRFFECMDRINRAVQGADDFDRVMGDVLDVVLVELGCDRAWLAHPCDPAAPAWAVPMERTRPE